MSLLHKGVLTVIAVTVSASVLILLTGENATAEADSHGTHSVKTTNVVSEPLDSSVAKVLPNTPRNPATLKNTLGDEGMQKESLHKPLLPAFPLSPPPIGPFQIARPNGYNVYRKTTASSVVPGMKQHLPIATAAPRQNIKASVGLMVKTMNQQPSRPPKGLGSQPSKPELQAKKANIPVNRLVKPQAPVQKIPKMFSTPPVPLIKQRYMYVPVPAQMYQQVLKIPMMGAHAATPNASAVENGQKNSGVLHENTRQPSLQPRK